jgi:hypothetical protein
MIIEYGKIRISEKKKQMVEDILAKLPYRYCFITGSFLFKEDYKDIDVFVITRGKKKLTFADKRINITLIDFNDLHSLFYHSIKKLCIAKNILPEKDTKATLANYWDVVNEVTPMILNEKDMYHKEVRDLILYTEYFKTGKIIDAFELMKKIDSFKDYNSILDYISKEAPKIFSDKISPGYIKRFFYSQAGNYKDMVEYDAQKYLYNLSHTIISKVA